MQNLEGFHGTKKLTIKQEEKASQVDDTVYPHINTLCAYHVNRTSQLHPDLDAMDYCQHCGNEDELKTIEMFLCHCPSMSISLG